MSHGTVNAPRNRLRLRGERRSALAVLTYGPLHRPTFTGTSRAVLLVLLIVIGSAISLARTPMRLWSTLWAEDGTIFLSGALNRGPGVIFEGYAGYMHLVPRLLAEFATMFPLAAMPTVITISAAVVTGLLACACFVFLETRVESVPLRFAVWIACLALPVMGGEVANNIANLHWYLLIAAFCAVAVRSRSRGFLVVQCIVVFAAVTSDALALLLLPFLAYRWWVYTVARDRVPSIFFLGGALVQLVVVISQLFGAGRPVSKTRPSAVELLDLFGVRVAVGSIFGVTPAVQLIESLGQWVPWVVLALIAAGLVLTSWADRSRRIGIATFALSSLIFASIVFVLQWDGFAKADPLDLYLGSRYATVPVALLLIAILLAVDSVLARVRVRWAGQLIALIVLVAVLIPVAIDYRTLSVREGAASWSDAVNQGIRDCGSGQNLRDGEAVLPAAPTWFEAMTVPCPLLKEQTPLTG